MKILEMCLSPDLGGLELYAYRTAVGLKDTDNVIGLLNPEGKLKDYFDKDGISWFGLGLGVKTFPLLRAIRLARFLDKHSVEVVHVHWGKDLALAVLAKLVSNIKPKIVYTRQMQITRNKNDFYHNFIYRNIDLILTITNRLEQDMKKYLAASFSNKIKTLYYGVKRPDVIINSDEKSQLRKELGIDNKAFLVGIFGRIKHEKGQYLVIEATNKLVNQHHNVHTLIVGHAMEEKYLTELKTNIDVNSLSDHVSFKDFVENPQRWMQICDVVVLASNEETFGLVLPEAMQAGISVIGTNSGGVPEIIDHGDTGLMFEYGDTNDLYDCLLAMKTDENKRLSYAKAGQEKAQSMFDLDAHHKKLREYFQEVIN